MKRVINHFEEVYTEAELVANRKNKDVSEAVMIEKIKALLGSYDALNTFAESDDIRNELKKAYMGEIFFLLSAISHRDNVNVWGALLEELEKNKLL